MNARAFANRSLALLTACLLAAGCHKEQPPPAPVATPKAPGIVSAEKNSFDEVTAKLNKGGNLFLYLSTEQMLRGLTNRISAISNFATALPGIPSNQRDTVSRALEALDEFAIRSGVDQISGIGMSSIAREPGFYYGKLVVHHYEGHDHGVIWSVFGAAPHPLELDLLPENTALALFSDFDLQMAWTTFSNVVASLDIPGAADGLRQAGTQFRQQTGVELNDVFHSLGGAYGIIFTLDTNKEVTLPVPGHPLQCPSPGLAIVIKVKSDLIFKRLGEALKDNPLISKVDEPDLKMLSLIIPLPIPMDIRPSVAQFDGYLIVASSDKLARQIVEVKSGREKGFQATAEFKKLSQDIPDAGNNFSLVTSAFSRAMIDVHRQFANQQTAAGHAMPEFFDGQSNSFSYSVGVNGPEGWEGFANGNHSAQGLIMPAAAILGAGAAIAIPNIIKARQASQQKSGQP